MREALNSRSRYITRTPLLALLGVALLFAACGSNSGETVDTSSDVETPAPAATAQDAPADDSEPDFGAEDPGMIDDGGEPLPIDVESLTAGTWTLMFGGGPEGEVVLVDGYPITMTFDGDGSFRGTAACNGYGGGYEINGSQISLGRIGWEEMGCAPEVQAAESAFLAALFDVDGINLNGSELALSGPSSELIFSRSDGLIIEELWGRSFVLEATLSDGVASPVEGVPVQVQEDVILAIHPNNTLTATTGCRTYEASFTVVGSEVVTTESSATGECPTVLADQDSHIISVLGDGFTVEFDGGQLNISSAGNQGLQYRDTTSDVAPDAPDEVIEGPAPDPPEEDG